ncbi:MAG TPA: 2-phospho-L-lactate transferase [Egibacteraceae bacterium]|nr:2-phospho-L-lactate transferase [Egibacteraceae bacterium]
MLVALAGGIGAARFLSGLVRVTEPTQLTVVGNTGDDLVLNGLHISPDLDTVAYTLGGGVHAGQGWGRAEETFAVASELRERYGRSDWFALGDRDIATHLVRSSMLAEGHSLSSATAEIARRWHLGFALVPMTDEAAPTRIRTADGRTLHFQEWWVGERAEPAVEQVDLSAARAASPAPGVIDALAAADAVILCPSNPVVSIGPILEVEGIRAVLSGVPVVGVSPIVGGQVVRGMADRLLPGVGVEVSAAGVARLYSGFLDGWVIDSQDAGHAEAIVAEGVRVAVTDTIMRTPEVTEALARTVLDLVAKLRGDGR